MQATKTKSFYYYLKWLSWILLAQFVLANVSAAIYAYKFTHFYNPSAPELSTKSIFHKTWKLFTGPDLYKDTSEPPPSFAYENVALKTSTGIPIDAWYSQTDSSKACVIFIHGYSVNKSFYEEQAVMFKHWGYSVLMIDLRGHGKSGGQATTFGAKETDELKEAYEYAKRRGYLKIVLYGGSLGAVVCIKAVAENKIQPQGIILDMPFGSLHEHLKARARILGFPSEPFAALTTFWIGAESGYNGFGHNVRSYAESVNCPVLLQWGDKDPLVTKEEIESVFKITSSKNKRLIVYPNAGHADFLKYDPETWEKEIHAFLSSVK